MNTFLDSLHRAVPNVHLRRFLILLCGLFVLEITTGFLSHIASDNPSRSILSSSSDLEDDPEAEVAADEPAADAPVPFPPNASARYIAQIPPDQFVAELIVHAPDDADVYNVIKIERAAGSQPIVQVYIEPGRQVRMLLPLSKYRIRLARGKSWKGDKDLFGKETRAYRTGVLDLSPRRDGTIPSLAVQLQGYVDGTTRGGIGIRKEQF